MHHLFLYEILYLSDAYNVRYKNKEDIQEYNEDLGDYDQVLFTFDENDKDEPFKSLASYLSRDFFFSKKVLAERLKSFNLKEVTLKGAVNQIKQDIVFDTDNNKDIVRFLLENNEIDKKTCDKLIKHLNKMLKKQLEFIDGVDYLSLDLNKNNSLMKKKK